MCVCGASFSGRKACLSGFLLLPKGEKRQRRCWGEQRGGRRHRRVGLLKRLRGRRWGCFREPAPLCAWCKQRPLVQLLLFGSYGLRKSRPFSRMLLLGSIWQWHLMKRGLHMLPKILAIHVDHFTRKLAFNCCHSQKVPFCKGQKGTKEQWSNLFQRKSHVICSFLPLLWEALLRKRGPLSLQTLMLSSTVGTFPCTCDS